MSAVTDRFAPDLKSLHDAYEKKMKAFQSQLKTVPITAFPVDYSKWVPIYASDGSYAIHYRIPHINVYLASLRAVGVEQHYVYQPDPSARQYTSKEPYDERNIHLLMKHAYSAEDDGTPPNKRTAQWAIEILMNALEKQVLYNHAAKSNGHLIMVDGALIEHGRLVRPDRDTAKFLDPSLHASIREHGTISDVIGACLGRNMLTGVSKDSGYAYYDASNPAEIVKTEFTYEDILQRAFLAQNLPKDQCYYYEVPDSVVAKMKTDAHSSDDEPIGVVYAKLHPHAIKWHRVDYLKDPAFRLKDILQSIAIYCQVYTAFGTPWCPQACHKLAKRVRDDTPVYKGEIERILAELGYSLDDVIETDVSGEVMADRFHDYTDHMI